MLKKTIKYTDYNGVERKEDFYFNISKAEAMEMELSTDGGLSETIRHIIDAQDMPSIVAYFKRIVLDAYGVKTPDGKRFIKSQELRDSFAQTEAYSDLFMELATNADAAAEFINGIVPHTVSTDAATGDTSARVVE